MGAGKSTIGRLLAKELRLPFKDSDKEIEQRTGADIPWIFDVEGEQGFREREQAVIVDLSAADGLVLATGGGAVLRAENRRALHAGGRVVYLHATVEQQIDRTSRDRNRPLLRTADPARVLSELMAICRLHVYAGASGRTGRCFPSDDATSREIPQDRTSSPTRSGNPGAYPSSGFHESDNAGRAPPPRANGARRG